jgi:putative ABC transport system permease protein
VALLVGSLAASITVSSIMDFAFSFSARTALEALLLAAILVAVLGGYGTWRVLRVRPVPYLRSE